MPINKNNLGVHIKQVNTGRFAKIVLTHLLVMTNLIAGPNSVASSIVDSGQSKEINQIDGIKAGTNRNHYEYPNQDHYEYQSSKENQHNHIDRHHHSHYADHDRHVHSQKLPQEQQHQVIVSNETTTTRATTTSTAMMSGNKLLGRQVNFNEIRTMRNRCLLAERELDRCSAQLIGMGQSSSSPAYPDNMHELNSVFCPKFRDTLGCIKNNTDCYRPFERQIISWILVSSRKMNHKRCKNENEKVRFLRLTNSCFTSMKNPMNACMTNYVGSLDAIADYNRELERLSEDDFQIKLACCANMRFKQCIMNSGKQMCKSHDTLKKLRRTNSNSSQRVARKQMIRALQDTMDDLRSTLDEMALTGPEFICSKIDEKFCKTTFDGRYTNRLPRHESIVPAMIKIYANK